MSTLAKGGLCPTSRIFTNLLLVVFCCLLFALGIIVFTPDCPVLPGSSTGFNFYHSAGRSLSPGRRAGFYLLCASYALLGVLLSRTRIRNWFFSDSKPALYALSLAAVAIVGGEIVYRSAFPASLAIGAIFAFVVWKKPQILLSKYLLLISSALCVVGFGELFYPLFRFQPNFCYLAQWPQAIAEFDAHTAFVLTGPADRLARGFQLGVNAQCPYGMFFQFLLAFIQKFAGVFDWTEVIKFLGWFQILFLILAAATYFKYARKRIAIAALVTVSLIPCFLSFDTQTYYPNLSATRFFAFPVATMYLIFFAPRLTGLRQFFVTGLAAGLCLLINTETGICAGFGLLLFILANNQRIFFPRKKHVITCAGLFFGGILGAFALFELAVFAGFGYFISLSAWLETLQAMIRLGLSGNTSSGRMTMFVLPYVAALHCGYILVRLAGNSEVCTRPQATSLSISAICLLWLSYYINSPYPHYFSAIYFLYLFLLIDALRTIGLNKSNPRWFHVALLALVFVFGCEAAAGWTGLQTGLQTLLNCERATPKDAEEFSGIVFPKKIADELKMRSQFLKKEAGQAYKLPYLTYTATLLGKGSGIDSDIPFNEIFISTMRPQDSQKVLNYFAKNRTPRVYIDPPGLALRGHPGQEGCVDFFRLQLKTNYRLEATTSGWEVWKLKP